MTHAPHVFHILDTICKRSLMCYFKDMLILTGKQNEMMIFDQVTVSLVIFKERVNHKRMTIQ